MIDESLAERIADDAAAAMAHRSPERVKAFIEMMEAKKPNSETIACAIVRAATSWGGQYHDHVQAMLRAQLQVALTREHVAAQDSMSRAAGCLAFVALGVACAQLLASCSP